MKKKIMLIIMFILISMILVACKEDNASNYELIYDRQYQAVAVNDFDLSEIILYNKKDDISIQVTREMLNAEDLNKTKIPGYHVIKIKYNGLEFECILNLVNQINYTVEYKYGLNAVLIENFNLSDVKIKINIDGNMQIVNVTEEMINPVDLEKLSTEGTHTITINYLNKELAFTVILVDKETSITLSLENPYLETSVKISEFVLSNIKIKVYNGENTTYVNVNETMLSTADLQKLNQEGSHNITITYNDYVVSTIVNLTRDEESNNVIIYEIYNPYANKDVLISDFNLSSITIKENDNGVVNTYYVNTSMLSVSDVNKLSTVGTHTITINFKGLSETITIKLVDSNNGNNSNTDISNIANGYYESAKGLSGTQLKYALRTIINTGTKDTTYDDLRTELPKTDPGSSSGKILLFYLRKDVNAAWDGGNTWNREHIWPQSLGWFKTSGAGGDIHHIRPTDPGENGRRGNSKYGETASTYEPSDNVKGDVARIIFYLLTRYSQTDSSYPVTKVATSMSMLLDWHELDPVDDIERYRNEKAYEIQKNRNPFIDVPEYAFYIWDTSRLVSEQKYDLNITIEIKIIEYFEDSKKHYFI